MSPEVSRQGVGRGLLTHVEGLARGRGTHSLTAEVSLTARPLFEAMGFQVVEERSVQVASETLTNFLMRKDISGKRTGR